MKVNEHKADAAESVWKIFSEDGRYGVTVIRYASGAMEVIPESAGTSCGFVPKKQSKEWARHVAGSYLARDKIGEAKRQLDDAMTRYRNALAEMPPVRVVAVGGRGDG